MEDRPVGASGLRVSRIGLGAAPLANMYADLPDEQALATVRAAHAGGVRLYDTAPRYGAGLSERRLGQALADVPRDSFVLATKVGRRVTPEGQLRSDWSRDGILRGVEESLGRLGLGRIDILHIHDPDAHYREALDVVFPALAELRTQGVIRAIGAGMNQWAMLRDFVHHADFDCFLLAGRYTLLEQGALPLLDLCHSRGVAVLLGGVFNSGILASGPRPGARYNYRDAPPEILDRVAQIAAICDRFAVDLPTAAVQFPLAHPATTSLVLGAVAPEEVAANIRALRASVPPELWAALRAAGLLAAAAPTP